MKNADEEKGVLERFKSGISMTSLVAIAYAMVVFTPAAMYLGLMGVPAGIGGTWFMLLLFIEMARLSGLRISKQEAMIIFIFGGGLMSGVPELLINRAWLRQSDIVRLFGLEHEFPDWFGPSPDSGAFLSRNLLHPAFIYPLSWRLLLAFALVFSGFAIGIWARELFIEAENLPFPLQKMSAETVLVLTGEEEKEGGEFPSRILCAAAVIGFLYGFALYALPFLYQSWTGQYRSFIPIPWFDWSSQIERFLPGAFLGLATDLGFYTLGFVLPFANVLQMFIGSFAVWVIGAWLTVYLNPPYGPFDWWFTGMPAQTGWGRAWLYFFTTPYIGLGFAAGLMPLLFHSRLLIRAFSSRARPLKERLSDPIPGGKSTIIVPIIAIIIITSGLFIFFTGDFSMKYPWVLPLFIVVPFINILLVGRGLGETGITISVTGVTNIIYYLVKAPTAVWMAPQPGAISGGYGAPAPSEWLARFKLAQLTETKASSLLKISLLFLPIATVVSFLFMQVLWSMAPIPSEKYPGPAIFWPAEVAITCVWIKGREVGLFNVPNLVYAFIGGAAIYAFSYFSHLPISLISLTAGASQPPHYALAWLIGGIVALGLRRVLGKEFWGRYRYILAGGIALGEGIAVTLGVSIALIINSLWTLPW